MTHPTAALETLGCKVNQYESAYFAEILKEAGFSLVPFRERADLYIVHSCAVTSRAACQTRQLLRRARRLNPDARIAALGCDAQLEPERLAADRLATHILGTEEKFDLLQWLSRPGAPDAPLLRAADACQIDKFRVLPVAGTHSGRARASLKIQDGCDASCSYCIVPTTRGRSRSLPPSEVRIQLDRLLASGYREVVLTGIHLGQWGKGLDPPSDLPALLEFLREGKLPARLRLSSLEPGEWTPRLTDALLALPAICPHFHIPLQSGDSEILHRMNRPYDSPRYRELILALHGLFPRAALGADILAGFPGETARHFQNTLDLLEGLPLAYLHVFPFSPRPGAPAAAWPGRATGEELKRRTLALRELGLRKRRAFENRFLGDWLEVLVEEEVKPGWWKGTSENYIQVGFPAASPMAPGALVRVRALSAAGASGLEGTASPA
jgi:threonylcarbamoyladenosine tRNA methylthiotransferase MtaB